MLPEQELVFFRRAPARLSRSALYEFAKRLQTIVAGGREFHCLITDDRDLRRLNRDFLARDYPPDVLSFPAASGPLLGELAISCQRACEQAHRFGHSLEQEIQLLMLHGLLHLLGMDHETDGGQMARLESHWRRRLGLPPGLIQRVES